MGKTSGEIRGNATKAKVLTMDQYLGKLGLGSPISDYMIDKMKVPHGFTASKKKQMENEAQKEIQSYQKKRSSAIADYNKQIASGKIVPPSKIQKLLQAAKGIQDNEATKAARRLLKKRYNITKY